MCCFQGWATNGRKWNTAITFKQFRPILHRAIKHGFVSQMNETDLDQHAPFQHWNVNNRTTSKICMLNRCRHRIQITKYRTVYKDIAYLSLRDKKKSKNPMIPIILDPGLSQWYSSSKMCWHTKHISIWRYTFSYFHEKTFFMAANKNATF